MLCYINQNGDTQWVMTSFPKYIHNDVEISLFFPRDIGLGQMDLNLDKKTSRDKLKMNTNKSKAFNLTSHPNLPTSMDGQNIVLWFQFIYCVYCTSDKSSTELNVTRRINSARLAFAKVESISWHCSMLLNGSYTWTLTATVSGNLQTFANTFLPVLWT